MRLFLVTTSNMDTQHLLAFLVHAETRHKAKSAVQRYCKEHGWDISVYPSTHDLGEETPIVRIDHLI